MTIRNRRTGWLNERFHAAFRELLLHGLARYHCCCPLYCLMPDHIHLMIVGWSQEADQMLFTRFFRKHVNEVLNEHLQGCELQREAHDHVMRRDELGESEFSNAALYIAANPLQAGLVSDEKDYAFSGALLPGFPRLGFWEERYWRIFWDATSKRLAKAGSCWNSLP